MIKAPETLQISNIAGMEFVEEELYNMIGNSHENTYTICNNLIRSGGKRIRPALVLCTAQCFGKLTRETIMAATACECIHMASLVHDDVIDESSLRRNKPTINSQKGNYAAVLVGDYLFAKAFEILSKHSLIRSMEVLVDAISKMCDGEIFQAENRFNLEQTTKDYYRRIHQKTGILLAACTKVGAITGGAKEEEIKALEIYGENIGYAFQIIDDILDFTGNEYILGKPVGSDLREGNITLPILKLINQREYKAWIQRIINEGITTENYNEIVRILKESYAIEESYHEAARCIHTAKKALENIEDSIYKSMLLHIADKILTRKN